VCCSQYDCPENDLLTI